MQNNCDTCGETHEKNARFRFLQLLKTNISITSYHNASIPHLLYMIFIAVTLHQHQEMGPCQLRYLLQYQYIQLEIVIQVYTFGH